MVRPPFDSRSHRIAAAICAGLLVLFGALAWTGARQASPTFDEPLHALAGWTSLKLHDHRLNDEHPPLWKYWSALPHLFAQPLQLNTNADEWKRAPTDHNGAWKWTIDTLFRTPEKKTRTRNN